MRPRMRSTEKEKGKVNNGSNTLNNSVIFSPSYVPTLSPLEYLQFLCGVPLVKDIVREVFTSQAGKVGREPQSPQGKHLSQQREQGRKNRGWR